METESAVPEQPALNLGGFMGGEIVQDDMHVELGGHLPVDLVQAGDEVVLVVAGADIGDDGAAGDVQRREQVDRAVTLIVVRGSLRGAGQHRQSRSGPVERLDLGFSSTANTTAAIGGFMYNPTRSGTFSIRSGSGDTLKLSWRHGLRPNARQISATVVFEIPCLAVKSRVEGDGGDHDADNRGGPSDGDGYL